MKWMNTYADTFRWIRTTTRNERPPETHPARRGARRRMPRRARGDDSRVGSVWVGQAKRAACSSRGWEARGRAGERPCLMRSASIASHSTPEAHGGDTARSATLASGRAQTRTERRTRTRRDGGRFARWPEGQPRATLAVGAAQQRWRAVEGER